MGNDVQVSCRYIDRRWHTWQRVVQRVGRLTFSPSGVVFDVQSFPRSHRVLYDHEWGDVARVRFTQYLASRWATGLPKAESWCVVQIEICGEGRVHAWSGLPRFVLPWAMPTLSEAVQFAAAVPPGIETYWSSEEVAEEFSANPPTLLLTDW